LNGLIPKLLIMKNLKVLAVIMAAITILGCTREPAVTSDTVNKEEISRQLAENWDQFIMAFTNEDIEKLMSFVTDDYINMPAYGWERDSTEYIVEPPEEEEEKIASAVRKILAEFPPER